MSCLDKRIGYRARDFSRNLKWPLLLFSILVWIPFVKNFLFRTKETLFSLRSNPIRSPLSGVRSYDLFDDERRRGIHCEYDSYYYLMVFLQTRCSNRTYLITVAAAVSHHIGYRYPPFWLHGMIIRLCPGCDDDIFFKKHYLPYAKQSSGLATTKLLSVNILQSEKRSLVLKVVCSECKVPRIWCSECWNAKGEWVHCCSQCPLRN